MNTFQTEVRDRLGVAVPGTIVEAAECYKLVEHFVCEDDKCVVGGFVRKGSAEGLVAGAANTSEVIGVITKDKFYAGCEPGMSVPKGSTVTVLIFGVMAVKNTSGEAAVFLDDVYVNDTDGTLSFDNTGSAPAGTSVTHWKVKQGCEAGGIAFITR